MAEMLKIDNIKKTFNPGTINEKVALNGVNLSLEEGDFVTVIGGNGDVDRGKYGDRRQTRTEPRALLGHYEKGARRLP